MLFKQALRILCEFISPTFYSEVNKILWWLSFTLTGLLFNPRWKIVRSQLNWYHVHVFLPDKQKQNLHTYNPLINSLNVTTWHGGTTSLKTKIKRWWRIESCNSVVDYDWLLGGMSWFKKLKKKKKCEWPLYSPQATARIRIRPNHT